MAAEDRTEQPVLHPAHIELLKLRIAWCRTAAAGVVATAEEAADVSIEIRTARHAVVQTKGYLIAQHLPRRTHVATPQSRAVALLTGKGRTCHDKYSLVGGCLALLVIHTADGSQRERIAIATPCAVAGTVVVV